MTVHAPQPPPPQPYLVPVNLTEVTVKEATRGLEARRGRCHLEAKEKEKMFEGYASPGGRTTAWFRGPRCSPSPVSRRAKRKHLSLSDKVTAFHTVSDTD